MPGPIPKPDDARRRRNAPTIPTTALPAAGFAGPYPKPPPWSTLGRAGKAWWSWAWRTPQAAAWSAGDLDTVTHRAELVDDLAAVDQVDGLDVAALLEIAPFRRTAELDWLIRRLHGYAAGRLAILKEAREIDDRLGLTPKGRLALRMTIIETEPATKKPEPSRSTARGRLRAVDSTATA